MLNSCGIGGISTITTVSIFEDGSKVEIPHRCGFPNSFMSFECGREYGNRDIFLQKQIGDVKVSLTVFNNSKEKLISFGILPLIPAPPIIPLFFIPATGGKEFCGGKNLKLVLRLSSYYDISNTDIDLNSIYLLKDNKKIYASNYYISDSYIDDKNNYYRYNYTIDFPISCKKSNNSLIFIENVKINNKQINIPISKIVYDSSIFFAMGYLVNN